MAESDKELWDKCYKEKCSIKSINPEVKLNIGDFYVNLEGVKCNEAKRNEEEEDVKFNVEQSPNFARRDNQNIGRRIRKDVVIPIQPEDIFAGNKKRILIYGSPGTGKTTLCKKVVYNFYMNKTWNNRFTNVIWIQLRNVKEDHCMKVLDGVHDDLITIQRNVIRILFETSGKTTTDWDTILDNKRNNVLYILDGWDEIHHLLEEQEHNKRFKNLMDMLYRQENIILTTRPYAYVNFKDFDQIFEITGFNPENIGKYTRKVLSETGKSETFEAVMEYIETTVVNDLTTIPILLDIFLFCWDDIQHFKETLTITRLYERLFLRLWLQFLERIGGRRKKVKTLFELQENESLGKLNDQLCCLGNKWLEEGTLDFSSYDIHLGENNISHVFFLNQTSANNPNEERFTFEFVHLTICEFFAALYIVKRTMENETFLTEFVPTHKYNTRLSVVFQFTAGLFEIFHITKNIKNENLALQYFFNCLEADPFDIRGSYHYPLLVNCLAECNIGKKRSGEIYDEIFQFISSRKNNLKMFLKLPNELVEMIMKKGNREIQIGLMNFRHRLPSFSREIITHIQNLEVKDSEKLKFLCLQVTQSEASRLCIDNLCTAIEEDDFTVLHDLEYNLTFLPSEMKLHIIKDILCEQLVKIDVCGTLANVYFKINELAEMCNIFEPSISITDTVEDIIKALINSEEIQSKRSINNLKFLKNMEGLTDIISNYIEEKLESKLGKKSDQSIFLWISTFEIKNENIIDKLIRLPQETVIEKNLRHKAMLSLLELYRGKDIPKEISRCTVEHFQNLQISNDNLKLDDFTTAFMNCGSMTVEEEELFKNWISSSYHILQNAYSPYLLMNRNLNEKQMEDLMSFHQNNIEMIDFVLQEHLQLNVVREFLSRNDVQTNIKLLHSVTLKKLGNYPNKYMWFVKPNYAENTLQDLRSKIVEIISKVKNTLWNLREFQRGALLSVYQDQERQKRLEECYITANSYFGLDETQKVAAMTYNFEQEFSSITYALYTTLEKMELEPDFEDKIKLQCQNLHEEYLGYYIFRELLSYLEEIRCFTPYLVKYMTTKNFQQIFHMLCKEIDVNEQQVPVYIHKGVFYYGIYNSNLENITAIGSETPSSYIDNCYTALGVDRCCRNIRLNVKKDFKKYTLQANLEDIRNIKENTTLLESIIEGSYWDSGSNKELLEKYIASYNHELRELMNTEFGLTDFPRSDEGLIKHEKESVKPCEYISQFYNPLDHQTRLALTRIISKQRCTEKAPLKSILMSFYHLDMSGKNITDKDISDNLTNRFIKFVRESNVHTIILSENLITQKGLHALLTSCCRSSSKVKHLFLDRNHIFFTELYFDNMIKTLKNDKREKTLEVLDISGNFVTQHRIEQLGKQNRIIMESDNFSYTVINNCKLILSRKINSNSILAAVDYIKEKEMYIDEENGCVAIAQMTNTLLGYSGHHLLIIENLEKGQRKLLTAELFAMNMNSCKIELKEVDSIPDFKNRMDKYSIKRANFPQNEITTLLNVIETSKQQQDFLRYEMDFDGDGMNCVKWVIKVMKTITDYNVVEIDTPPSIFMEVISFLRRTIRDERRRSRILLYFLAVIVAVFATLFFYYKTHVYL